MRGPGITRSCVACLDIDRSRRRPASIPAPRRAAPGCILLPLSPNAVAPSKTDVPHPVSLFQGPRKAETTGERRTLRQGKAAERACLPPQHWPGRDRQLWLAACAPADPLEEQSGARSEHSAIANRNVEKGYGRWLTFLHRTDAACLVDLPSDRITPERTRAYIGCLVGLQNGTAAILSRLRSCAQPPRSWDQQKTGGS